MLTWIKNLRSHFIDDCRAWWKMWSSWLAIVWGLIVTLFWNNPTMVQEIVNVLPADVRAGLSPVVLALVAGLPILVRLLKQRKLGGQ